jgi:serine/threonine protein kinase
LIVLEKHGIIHRDIKTRNNIICIDGSYKLGLHFFFFLNFFNIGDYSIARTGGVTLTGVAGTEFVTIFYFLFFCFIDRGYVAPEVLKDEEFVYIY